MKRVMEKNLGTVLLLQEAGCYDTAERKKYISPESTPCLAEGKDSKGAKNKNSNDINNNKINE